MLARRIALGACGDDEEAPEPAPSRPPQAACAKADLDLADGKLTVGTDKPAFPPYFEDDDPANGNGFESAVAYGIAGELGFEESEVKWTVVPFNASYRPGSKDFDFDINQISITPARARRSISRTVLQGAAGRHRAEEVPRRRGHEPRRLADTKIGVQIGTTSLDAVTASIKPTKQPKVFDDSNAVVTALKQGQVDAAVVDLPTALYLTAAEMPGASVVGDPAFVAGFAGSV